MAAAILHLKDTIMILRKSFGIALLLVLALAIIPTPDPAPACAVAPPRNSNKVVAIADESAVIIWDAKSKTEHFIRRASFKTDAENFGFLVPTPSKPTLAEASDEIFTDLAKVTAPRVVTQSAPSGGGGCSIGCASPTMQAPAGKAEAPEVHVLDEQRVGGYDAAVLEANDPGKLRDWLQQHEYEVSPRLEDWVRPYLEAKWLITAFKIAKKTLGEPAEPTAKDNRKQLTRLLRVFFVSDKRMQGAIGDKAVQWPGQTVWANKLDGGLKERLQKQVKLDFDWSGQPWWLTEFEDHSSPRPGTDDVYFSPSTDQSTVEREPHVKYAFSKVPDCVMGYALAAYIVVPCLIRCVRRKK
jgi:hypothetical protein